MVDTVERIRVWDPFIRVFHWSLATAWLIGWVTAEEVPRLHEQLGYFLLVLIGLRVVWGLVGTRYARFAEFLRGPATTLAYLRSLVSARPRDYIGHNPVGGWMIIVLMSMVVLTALSGVMLGGTGEAGEELHEVLAHLTLVFVVAHVVGVLVSSLLHRENLVRSLLTGNKMRRNVDV